MKVSILVTSYNQKDYILETLKSAIENMGDVQRDDLCTLYLFDDCSTDGTYERALAFLNQALSQDKFVTEKNETNLGICENYRGAISAVSGDYIAFLEGDDIWPNGHLSALINAAKANNYPNLVWTLPTLYIEKKVAKLPIEKYAEDVREALANSFDKEMNFSALFIKFFPMNLIPSFSGVLCKRAIISGQLNFFPPIANWLDFWVWSQIIPKGNGICLSETSFIWRITGSSLNSDSNRASLDSKLIKLFERKIWIHLHRSSKLKSLIGRIKKRILY